MNRKRVESFNTLQNTCDKLLSNATKRIQRERTDAARVLETRFCIGEFLLTEAKEFAESSWEELKAGRSRASLSASRWILEAALNLLWANMEAPDCDNRLNFLRAEALRQERLVLDSLAELNTEKAKELKISEVATKAKEAWKALEVKGNNYPKSLDQRIKSLMPRLEAKACPNPYPLYRICCGAAHPSLDVWRHFQWCPNGARITLPRPDYTSLACFISAASTWWLVAGAYRLTIPDNPKLLTELNDWWNDICPLLDAGFMPH